MRKKNFYQARGFEPGFMYHFWAQVMNELGLLFPYTAVYLFDELFSPILTPFILIWHLRYQ